MVSPPSGFGTAPAARNPANVRFLTFQGGGGKGIAYLGALQWLEDNGAHLPLLARPGLGGVAGASAGAMTAFMVYLGYSAAELQQRFTDLAIGELVDDPELGVVRCVASDRSQLELSPKLRTLSHIVGYDKADLTLATAAWNPFMDYVKNRELQKSSLTSKLMASKPEYYLCLLLDGGFVSGIKLRGWLASQIFGSPAWANVTAATKASVGKQTKVTFRQLYEGTRVTLAIITTNLTTCRPVVFSHKTTPDFPVADAVAMSASLPGVFKPVWVSRTAPIGKNIAPKIYTGWYADGGMMNNVPIHAFDTYPRLVLDPYADSGPRPAATAPLNPFTLGLRLEEGDPGAVPRLRDPPEETLWLKPTLGAAFEALNFGANQGQLRSLEEVHQSVVIYTDGIGLTDFVKQPKANVEKAFRYARDAMNHFYGESGFVPMEK